ncbi:MAG: DUF1287 domain-containing protein [Micropepsaceae bacterium]
MLSRRTFLAAACALPFAVRARAAQITLAQALIEAARTQVGVTTLYDPAYVQLAYPMGDVPRDRGVCTDVVIRALRDGLSADLQQLVHEDMRAHFAKYPKLWGLSSTDRNIDHRRVPNLRRYFERRGMAQPPGSDILPGDLVTMTVPPNLPHIAIVSDAPGRHGQYMMLHNIGRGTQEEDRLTAFPMTGHYRWTD